MALLKHVGKYGEKPCVVVMRTLPDDSAHCLITLTGNLPHGIHDELMTMVQSSEAQAENTLANFLSRRQFSDGDQVLSKLHYSKFIQKVPVNLVMLTPSSNQAVPLVDVNAEIDKIAGGYVPPNTDASHLTPKAAEPESPATAEMLLNAATELEKQAEAMLAEAALKKEAAAVLISSTGQGEHVKTGA